MEPINENKLKSKIVSKGFNYSSLAKEIGVDRDTISHVVNNKHTPSYKLINKLYYTLNMSPDEGIEIFFGKNLHNKKVLK